MSERMSFKVQRMELREQRQRLELACKHTLEGVRERLNPVNPVTDIDEDAALNFMLILSQQLKELKGIDVKLSILHNELEG